MVASSGKPSSSVLRQAIPERSAGSNVQGVCADPHDSWSSSAVGTDFTGLHEEVDAPLRPMHSAGAIGQSARSDQPIFKLAQQGIELLQVIDAQRTQVIISTCSHPCWARSKTGIRPIFLSPGELPTMTWRQDKSSDKKFQCRDFL